MPEKDEEAREMALKHFELEEGMRRIFRLTGSDECQPTEPIKLLEVNDYTVPSGIMPIQFGPAPASGVHFPSIILEVTPDEFEDIQADRLPLPHGWQIGEEFLRPTTTQSE
ncbi:MAG: hypothetical protein KY475_00335 [Planctomycetes bacterium]|nr:hypothetical protein [Planctomycetota bacterium]